MAYFTTYLPELVKRATDALSSHDIDLALESYEFIARFHPNGIVPDALSKTIACEAESRCQYLLASHALRKLALDPSSYSAETLPDVLDSAMRLGLIYSQKLMNPMFAMPYLKAYSEYGRSNLDIVSAEIERLEKIHSLRSVPNNPEDAQQFIVKSGRVDIVAPTIAQELAEITGINRYEFSRHMNPDAGIILKNVSGAERAEMVVNFLARKGIHSFYIASQTLDTFQPKMQSVTSVKIVDSGLEIYRGITPSILKWDEIWLVDCGQVMYDEKVVELKHRLYYSTRQFVSDGSLRPTSPTVRTVEKRKCIIAIILAGGAEGFLIDTEKSSILRPYAYTSTVVKAKEEWFAEYILQNSPNAFFGMGLHLLALDGTSGDWSGQIFRSSDDFTEYLTWMILLRRLGIT